MKICSDGAYFFASSSYDFQDSLCASFVGFETSTKKHINETDAHPKEILPGQNGFYDAKNSLELNWRQLMQDLPKFENGILET